MATLEKPSTQWVDVNNSVAAVTESVKAQGHEQGMLKKQMDSRDARMTQLEAENSAAREKIGQLVRKFTEAQKITDARIIEVQRHFDSRATSHQKASQERQAAAMRQL